MPKGKKTPIRYDQPHGQQSFGTFEENKTRELGIPGLRVIVVDEKTRRKVRSTAVLKNKRQK